MISEKNKTRWKAKSTSWRARISISARPSSWAKSCSTRWALEGGRKTKTGAWSTDVDVLEEVAAQGHPIAQKVLEWRGLAKLRGTYTDALPGYINPKTGRVHTSYAMASTSTGRLASTDPNLQNIPVRTEEGRRIRQAFITPTAISSSAPITARSSCGCWPISPTFPN